MAVKEVLIKLINNKDRIVINLCFWSLICFNILLYCFTCFQMFIYDGGTYDPKSYYEIRTMAMAHNIFISTILKSWLYGILFAFPPIWSYFFTRQINLNAILIQLLPILIIVGLAFFS